MFNTNWNGLQKPSNNPSPQNSVFSEIVKEVFGDITQYETDVPQGFERPCFLFIHPEKTTRTRELTRKIYQVIKTYEIYFFAKENDVEKLTEYKDQFIDYLMGVKKIPIPRTDRYYTIERVAADTDDVNFMVAFMIEVSRIVPRDLRKPTVPKIQKVVNQITLDGRNTSYGETEQSNSI